MYCIIEYIYFYVQNMDLEYMIHIYSVLKNFTFFQNFKKYSKKITFSYIYVIYYQYEFICIQSYVQYIESIYVNWSNIQLLYVS